MPPEDEANPPPKKTRAGRRNFPHLLRPFVGYRPGKLLAASALGGAVLLLASDIAVRLIPSLVELKLGVVTSMVGAPFFLLLIFRMRRKML